jgi:hypothetical protein
MIILDIFLVLGSLLAIATTVYSAIAVKSLFKLNKKGVVHE